MQKCPICTFDATVDVFDHGERFKTTCTRCGHYIITGSAVAILSSDDSNRALKAAILGYWIRQRNEKNTLSEIDSGVLEFILKEVRLPRPREQADKLICWIGNNAKSAEELLHVVPANIAPVIGAVNAQGVEYIAVQLKKMGTIVYVPKHDKPIEQDETSSFGLTFSGWDRYEELRHSSSSGRTAFMAMQYGDAKHDQIYQNYFKPAVFETGFELFRLDEKLAAGLIDNQMRVEIRNARLILADLTNDNNGAYWEAGYAEGLGKPVIYLCEAQQFNKFKTHFDTNHYTTVVWDQRKLALAKDALKSTIRATLPLEAKMTDD